MMGQPEKRAKAPAPDWNNRGGTAHNSGWEQPEQSQDTGRRPPWTGKSGGSGAKERKNTGLDQLKRNKISSGKWDRDRGPDDTNREEGQEERGKGGGGQPQTGTAGQG